MRKRKTSTGLMVGWDEAIQDAKLEIQRLRESIRFFKKEKRAGRPFPFPVSNAQSPLKCFVLIHFCKC
jgi:hypothetical protein